MISRNFWQFTDDLKSRSEETREQKRERLRGVSAERDKLLAEILSADEMERFQNAGLDHRRRWSGDKKNGGRRGGHDGDRGHRRRGPFKKNLPGRQVLGFHSSIYCGWWIGAAGSGLRFSGA